jgi:hypothetical protein
VVRIGQDGDSVSPFRANSYGVVSLLAMLEFYARKYLDIVHRFGLLLGSGKPPDPDVTSDIWTDLSEETVRMDLPVTKELIDGIVLELVDNSPESFKLSDDSKTFEITGAVLTHERMKHHVEAIYKTLTAEIGSFQLRAIPREKSRYCNPKWLADGILTTKYPDSVDEFQRAGRCFAYGENTACIFHLMRVTEFYLKKVADSLQVPFHANNWCEIGKHITKEMENKHQLKTDAWKSSEPFYAAILTDIQAISRGHRNPALHELEKKYDEREAHYMLTVIEEFASHVASKI